MITVTLLGPHQEGELTLKLRAPRNGSIPPAEAQEIEVALLREWADRVGTAITVGPLLMVATAVEQG